MAIKLYGQGHVICFNEVHNFHDGIDCETYGNPDGSFATDPNARILQPADAGWADLLDP